MAHPPGMILPLSPHSQSFHCSPLGLGPSVWCYTLQLQVPESSTTLTSYASVPSTPITSIPSPLELPSNTASKLLSPQGSQSLQRLLLSHSYSVCSEYPHNLYSLDHFPIVTVHELASVFICLFPQYGPCRQALQFFITLYSHVFQFLYLWHPILYPSLFRLRTAQRIRICLFVLSLGFLKVLSWFGLL